MLSPFRVAMLEFLAWRPDFEAADLRAGKHKQKTLE